MLCRTLRAAHKASPAQRVVHWQPDHAGTRTMPVCAIIHQNDGNDGHFRPFVCERTEQAL